MPPENFLAKSCLPGCVSMVGVFLACRAQTEEVTVRVTWKHVSSLSVTCSLPLLRGHRRVGSHPVHRGRGRASGCRGCGTCEESEEERRRFRPLRDRSGSSPSRRQVAWTLPDLCCPAPRPRPPHARVAARRGCWKMVPPELSVWRPVRYHRRRTRRPFATFTLTGRPARPSENRSRAPTCRADGAARLAPQTRRAALPPVLLLAPAPQTGP